MGLDIAKRYIDLAHDMGWEYFLLDDGWEGTNEYELHEVIEYANSRSVGVFLWAHQGSLFSNREQMYARLFPWKEQGIKGIKIDFWEDDSQEMMKKYDTFLEVTAELELLVNLHGCTKPSGTRRKWPHLLTSEAVLGGEFYIQEDPHMVHAGHNINLTLTRNVIGPMDYTPVDFARKNGKIQNTTSWSHQVALAVAYESGMQCYLDCPQNYKYHMAENFLKDIPAKWDDISCLEADPDNYVTIARRSGKEWYVASLCNSARTISLSFDFLEAGRNYYAYVYKDGDCRSEIQFECYVVTNKTVLDIPMLEKGGVTVRLSLYDDLLSPVVLKYEAEASRSFGVKVTDPDNLCSGGVYMTQIGRGNTLRFQQVEVQEEGEYALTLYYMTGEERSAYIKINEEEPLYHTFESSGGWTGNNLAYITTMIYLPQGINQIEIGHPTEFTPYFDRITIKTKTDTRPDPVDVTSVNYAKIEDVEIECYVKDGKLYITATSSALCTLYTADGYVLFKDRIQQGINFVPVTRKGICIVNVNSGSTSYSTKVLID